MCCKGLSEMKSSVLFKCIEMDTTEMAPKMAFVSVDIRQKIKNAEKSMCTLCVCVCMNETRRNHRNIRFFQKKLWYKMSGLNRECEWFLLESFSIENHGKCAKKENNLVSLKATRSMNKIWSLDVKDRRIFVRWQIIWARRETTTTKTEKIEWNGCRWKIYLV